MSSYSCPPVFDCKNVLQNHIRAKLIQFIPLSSAIIDDLVAELCETRNNQDIINLLVDDDSLKNSILNLKVDCRTKQKLGGELFYCVSKLETSLCAQITGMLLELDAFTICDLLQDSNKLECAVFKAKEEYLKFKQNSSKDLIGEELYNKVLQRYSNPDLAAKLTGMLMELDLSALQTLLDSPSEFNDKLEIAYQAANTSKEQ